MNSGNHIGAGFGLMGSEDLGGGLKTVFKVENGFGANDGTFASSGSTPRMFGRQAWIGLSKDNMGTLSFGRQYDFMLTGLCKYASGCLLGAPFDRAGTSIISGLLGGNGSNPDIDRLGGARVDNSIRYVSPSFGGSGLSFGAMYGLGGAPGSLTQGSTSSFYLGYAANPIDLGIAYTSRQDPTSHARYSNVALGGSYEVGKFTLNALLTQARWSATGDTVSGIDFNFRYQFNGAASLLVGYTFSSPNHGLSNQLMLGKRHTFGTEVDYFLSKRTDLYASVAYQKATEGQKAQFLFMAPSRANWAAMTQVGIRHRF
ncbi:porin [Pandoraea terrae]|uniref:Porin n=2 Tax=Pandoraea terrae TaxID=1537710 RepID=A0A5E4XPN8_9BURK|nr:porin [Pandoraea terrae]